MRTSARANTIEHRYAPRGSARALFADRSPEILVSGPAGTGKSRACLEKVHALCKKYPGMRALLLRKTLVSLTSTGLVTWREHVADKDIETREVYFYGGSREEPAQYRYANGSVVVIGGMDNPTKVMSSEYDVIYVQESTELTPDEWEKCTTRLRNGVMPYQQLLADCNPDAPRHWLKVRCDEGRCVIYNSVHEENPVYFNADGTTTEKGASYMAKLDALTGVRRLRLRAGLWAAAEGVIYDGWQEAVHVIDRFEIPTEWVRWWAVDFGYTNPFVLQCWAEDPDGRLFLYREIYKTQTLVEDHAATIMGEVATLDPEYVHPVGRPRYAYHGMVWREPKPRGIICDHDAEDRATLERHVGLGTIAATKTVSDGIQAVAARLRPAGDGRPRLFILRDSVVQRDTLLLDSMKPASTQEEVPGYVWDTANGKKIKEDPLKEDDHGCDAKRYMVAERDLRPRPRLRRM
jgi:phage terminase large subunit